MRRKNERGNNLFWISRGVRPGVGYFYALTPIYMANRLQAMLGVEQTIRMESFFTPGSLPMSVTILDDNGQQLISLAGPDNSIKPETRWMQERMWFWLQFWFPRAGAEKKSLLPSSLSIVYSVSVDQGAGAYQDADPQRYRAEYPDRRDPVRAGAYV